MGLGYKRVHVASSVCLEFGESRAHMYAMHGLSPICETSARVAAKKGLGRLSVCVALQGQSDFRCP